MSIEGRQERDAKVGRILLWEGRVSRGRLISEYGCWRGRWSDLRGDDSGDTIVNQFKRYRKSSALPALRRPKGLSRSPYQRLDCGVRLPNRKAGPDSF